MWDQVGKSLTRSMTEMLSRFAGLLPGIAALVAALFIAFLIAWILGMVLRRSLKGFDFDRRVERWGFATLAEWSPGRSPTRLVTRAVFWIVVLIGFLVGISAFDATITSRLVERVFAYLPNMLAAVVVLVAGNIIARFLARSILIGAVNMNLQYAGLLAAGVKWLVNTLAVAMALEHLSIGGDIIRLAFGILFGGIVLALALAVGLGSRDLVSRSLDEVSRTSRQSKHESVGHL